MTKQELIATLEDIQYRVRISRTKLPKLLDTIKCTDIKFSPVTLSNGVEQTHIDSAEDLDTYMNLICVNITTLLSDIRLNTIETPDGSLSKLPLSLHKVRYKLDILHMIYVHIYNCSRVIREMKKHASIFTADSTEPSANLRKGKRKNNEQ